MGANETRLRLVAVNVGRRRTVTIGDRPAETGIHKEARVGPVSIDAHGLSGDVVVDTRNHGGPDQAVYLYGADDYAWWARELGRSLAPGTFGENLTLSRLPLSTLRIGDRFRIGEVLLEVTAPRLPCAKLAARMGDPGFAKTFVQARRPGAYARVLAAGAVQAGDVVEWLAADEDHPTVLELNDLWLGGERDPALLARLLAAPLAERARVAVKRWAE